MKVSKLIDKLSQFPPEMPVLVSGYEDGYNKVKDTTKVKVRKYKDEAWYFGSYEDADNGKGFEAVFLMGEKEKST